MNTIYIYLDYSSFSYFTIFYFGTLLPFKHIKMHKLTNCFGHLILFHLIYFYLKYPVILRELTHLRVHGSLTSVNGHMTCR